MIDNQGRIALGRNLCNRFGYTRDMKFNLFMKEIKLIGLRPKII